MYSVLIGAPPLASEFALWSAGSPAPHDACSVSVLGFASRLLIGTGYTADVVRDVSD